MRSFLPTLALALALSATAGAVPMELVHQGRLLDAAGAPLDGSHALSVAIYDAPAGGSTLWSEAHSVDFDNGFFSITLGSSTPLDAAAFDGSPLYLGVSVDGGAELPQRVALASVPYALTAGSASSLDGGTVNATEIRVNGSTIIDSSGQIDFAAIKNAPVPTDTDTLGDLSCGVGQLAAFDGSAWKCGDAADHDHLASDITAGTIDVARLPIGTTGAHVAAGDHGHTNLSGAFQFDDSAGKTCDSSAAGKAKFEGGAFQICDGKYWLTFEGRGGVDGSSSTAAASSCKQLKADHTTLPSGKYWIDPDDSGPVKAYQVWCDMKQHAGGWTQIFNLETDDGATRHYFDASFWEGPNTFGDVGTSFAEDYKSLAFKDVAAAEIMIVAHRNGSVIGTATYDILSSAKGKTLHWMFTNLSNTTITAPKKEGTGSVGSAGRARNAGDAFIDQTHAIIINSRWQPRDADNYTRLGTNYASVCGVISCDGHNYGGIGGRHYRGGWGASYEAAALNGYCNAQGGYGSNGTGYSGNDAFNGCGPAYDKVDLAIFIR